jgi:hypothetical protein
VNQKCKGKKKGLRKIPQPFFWWREIVGVQRFKDLFVQKNPGQLLPAGLGKITVNVIA